MSNKISFALGAAFALALSGAAFAESAAKLDTAHEKAEADLQTMDAKEAAKLDKAHEKAEADLQTMDAKKAAKLEKTEEKAEAHVEKIESE